jgi:hypothetical protein
LVSHACRVLIFVGLFAGLSCRHALALTVNREALSQELNDAPLVVRVRIGRVDDALDFDEAHFRAEASVERVFRAPASAWDRILSDRITIVGPGGNRGSHRVGLPGFPFPLVGHRYRAHLRPSANGARNEYEIVGFQWGFVPEDGNGSFRGFSRNRVDGTDGQGTGPFLRWPDAAFPIPFAMRYPDFQGRRSIALAIERAFQTWRAVPGVRFDVMPMGCVQGISEGNDGINSVHFVTENWPYGDSAIAITRNHFYATGPRAGHIIDTDILLNAVKYDFATDGSPTKHDVQNVITHEVGHFFGLGHETHQPPFDVDSTMYPYTQVGETLKRTLAPNDIAGIQDAYPGQGPRPAWVPLHALCALDRGPSCGAVPLSGAPAPSPLRALFWLGAWLLLLLATGRALVRPRSSARAPANVR